MRCPPLAVEWAIGATGMGWQDYYAGAVDEVAIYGTALSPAAVKAHYDAAVTTPVPPVTLTIGRPGGVTTVTWSGGTLQQADTLIGPWSDMASATSPYLPPAGPAVKFYRVKL